MDFSEFEKPGMRRRGLVLHLYERLFHNSGLRSSVLFCKIATEVWRLNQATG